MSTLANSSPAPDKQVKGLHFLGLSNGDTELLDKELRASHLNAIDITIINFKGVEEGEDPVLIADFHFNPNMSKELLDVDALVNKAKQIIFSYVDKGVINDFHIYRYT